MMLPGLKLKLFRTILTISASVLPSLESTNDEKNTAEKEMFSFDIKKELVKFLREVLCV